MCLFLSLYHISFWRFCQKNVLKKAKTEGWGKRCKGDDGHINGLPIEEGFKHSTYYVLQLKSSATYKKKYLEASHQRNIFGINFGYIRG